MMLVQSSLPSTIDAGLSSVAQHVEQEHSCVWIPSDGSWQEPTVCNEHPQLDQSHAIEVIKNKNKDDNLCSINLSFSSQLSNMSEISTPNLVYKRRKIQKKADLCDVLPPNQCSTPTFVYKRRKFQTESKSGSVDGDPLGDELIEDPKGKRQKSSNVQGVNDSCSSSKSNLDTGSSLKQQVDDVGECSSSGVVIMEGSSSCFSFLRKHGVFERSNSKKPTVVEKNTCLRACQVCDRSTTTLKMLICDLCEESFHMSCCNPVIKKVPAGDWFCHSCSRKKLKKMETSSRTSSQDSLGPIASMLRDDHRYASIIRIGENFQAEVPDWSGPLASELNDYIEPMEIIPSECASYQEWNSSKLSRLSSIGNWIQCREVVDDVDGTICGKWRRAPLFEVQTDNWECFSSVLWDPTHADCAAPQELDSDQVLKQLKYIEMLRPRLSARRWKRGAKKAVAQREHSGDPRNRQKS
uniref:uncharacterized protein LOC122598888 n=1 Tax=Erigeron canadensis TaxID=72917 RepID=UPI001CB93050|nr:uncharacterized protein LOC122598888 [Erigeron canadensis]